MSSQESKVSRHTERTRKITSMTTPQATELKQMKRMPFELI
jgi:hypothetical protein